MPGPWASKRVLVTVRTYPTPAQKGIEVSCTAGVTDSGDWIRLFPVPFRFMPQDKRFRKYQWIDVRVKRASDQRPESHTLDLDSVVIVSDPLPTVNKWQARKAAVAPLLATSLCRLEAERRVSGAPTLGLFRPREIERLEIRPASPEWSPDQLGRLRQIPLFVSTPAKELEKLPYEFRYSFRCDEASCEGHNLMCTDWEVGEAYRQWRQKYNAGWEEKFRQRFEIEMIELNDTHFYVGTVHRFPAPG